MKINQLETLAKGTPIMRGKETLYFQGIEPAGSPKNPGAKKQVKLSKSSTGRTTEYANPLACKLAGQAN